MKALILALSVLATACGARIDDDTSVANQKAHGESDGGTDTASSVSPPRDETGVTSAVDAGPAPSSGCPLEVPTTGQSCIASSGSPDEHFYCHYFAPGESCVSHIKCTQSDGTGEPAHFYDLGPKDCRYAPADCDDGKSCGSVFERDGACIVACSRICMCDGPTGLLKCKAIGCE